MALRSVMEMQQMMAQLGELSRKMDEEEERRKGRGKRKTKKAPPVKKRKRALL